MKNEKYFNFRFNREILYDKIQVDMDSDLELVQFRLLDVDNQINLPVDSHVRLIVSATGGSTPSFLLETLSRGLY